MWLCVCVRVYVSMCEHARASVQRKTITRVCFFAEVKDVVHAVMCVRACVRARVCVSACVR